jgi:hypothetical protein
LKANIVIKEVEEQKLGWIGLYYEKLKLACSFCRECLVGETIHDQLSFMNVATES